MLSNLSRSLVIIIFILIGIFNVTMVQAQEQQPSSQLALEAVDDITTLQAEHNRNELFLYVREHLCPAASFSTVESEQYIDLIEYGDNVEFVELCREEIPIYKTERIYYKAVQNNADYGERIAIIMCKVSKDHTCFIDFKVILEKDEQPGCL